MTLLHRWLITFPLALFSVSTVFSAESQEDGNENVPVAASPAVPVGNSAPVVVWGRTLVVYRLPLEFTDVQQRAKATSDRISRSLSQIDPDQISVQQVQIGKSHGFVLTSGVQFLLSVMEGDLDQEAAHDLKAVADRVIDDLRELVRDHSAQHSLTLVIRSSVQAVIATVLFVVFWTGALWLRSRLVHHISDRFRESRQKLLVLGFDLRPVMLGVAVTAMRLVVLVAVLFVAYGWVAYVLSLFPYTRRWAGQLGSYLVEAVAGLATGAVHQIPNLIALIVIYTLTRFVVRIMNGWFSAIETGRYFTMWLDPEAARATRRLTIFGVWIFALIVAFPYLPGSHSEAFKGISVFLGVMVSLGGAGFIGQVIGGLAAVYSRAVRSGDFIAIGDTQGVVKELGMLSAKVVTRNGEEVTIPNSMLISTAIRNFSRSGSNATAVSTTVTIGYDTPWRQVEECLLLAAAQTDGLLHDPKPRVLQTVLDDFYVRYELIARAESAYMRSEVLARLHGTIQDVFTERGLQIMSPHFHSQPSAPVIARTVIPPSDSSDSPATQTDDT